MVLSCRENKGEFHDTDHTDQYEYIPFSILIVFTYIKLCVIFQFTEYYARKYF